MWLSGRNEQELVIPQKCSQCKLKDVKKCEGRGLIKGAILVICPSFIDKRSNLIINDKIIIPFPVNKKAVDK